MYSNERMMKIMITPVGKLHFETQKDIIDYVSRGMCPTKENFNALMMQVRTPVIVTPDDPNNGKIVQIDPNAVTDENREVVAAIMERVYENRKWNRNMMIAGTIGVIALGLLIHHGVSSSDEKDTKDDKDLVLYRLDNGDLVDLDRIDVDLD